MAISGQIVNVGDSIDVSYSGGMQDYDIPFNGLYRLEVWGSTSGAAGGYASGYAIINKGQKLYICCGGSGGYNGGGTGVGVYDGQYYGYNGGGATHIAKVNGTLANIGKQSFVDNGNGYIVAGGGGGAERDDTGYHTAGVGGGTNGGNSTGGGGRSGIGGSQTAAGGPFYGAFGKGADNQVYNAGGGGGFYGGGSSAYSAGAGGSGWIGGVPQITFKGTTYAPSMSSGVNPTSGKAKITLIAKTFPEMYLGEIPVDGAYLGDIAIDELHLGELAL